MYKWGRKEHSVKCKTHTQDIKEKHFTYMEESTSKHRASSSSSAYYACRNAPEDTGTESISYSRCAERNKAYSKDTDDDRDTEILARAKWPARDSIIKCRDHSSATGEAEKEGVEPFELEFAKELFSMGGRGHHIQRERHKTMPKEPSSNSAGNSYQSSGSVGYWIEGPPEDWWQLRSETGCQCATKYMHLFPNACFSLHSQLHCCTLHATTYWCKGLCTVQDMVQVVIDSPMYCECSRSVGLYEIDLA